MVSRKRSEWTCLQSKPLQKAHLIDMNDIIREGHPTYVLSLKRGHYTVEIKTSSPGGKNDAVLALRRILSWRAWVSRWSWSSLPWVWVFLAHHCVRPKSRRRRRVSRNCSIRSHVQSKIVSPLSQECGSRRWGRNCLANLQRSWCVMVRHARVTVDYMARRKSTVSNSGYNSIVNTKSITSMALCSDRINRKILSLSKRWHAYF